MVSAVRSKNHDIGTYNNNEIAQQIQNTTSKPFKPIFCWRTIIIQLYFRPQWVHRKDNTKDAEHYPNNQIRLKHVGLSQCCEVIQGRNPSAVQFRRDMCITVNYTMCNQIKGDIKSTTQTIYRSSDSCLTTIDIRGCKHGTCTAPHRQTTQDTKRIIIRYNKLAHASLSIGDP